jgi:carboxylate-amine ligase
MDAKLIDFGEEREKPMRDLAEELIAFVDDVVDELGSRREVEYLRTIAREGTSADRQLATFQRTGHLHEVVNVLAAETLEGVPMMAL